MPYWLGYSIYSYQNLSTSIRSSIEAEEKGPPSDLESHGQPLNPCPEIITGSDTPQLCLIGLGTVYIAPKILVLVSVLPWQERDRTCL